MKTLTALALGTMFLALPLAAQMQPPGTIPILGNPYGPSIAARQATPEEMGYQEVGATVVPSPMLLDISLGAYARHLSLLDMNPRDPWILGETAAFVCGDARLQAVQIQKDHYPGRYELTVQPTIQPEIPGRILGLTMAIVSYGQVLQRQTWNVNTRGVLRAGEVLEAAGRPHVEFHFTFTEQEFQRMFARGQAPLLRVILEVP